MYKLKFICLITAVILFAGCERKKPSKVEVKPLVSDSSDTSSAKTILVFGDSLTAGFGLNDPSEAFPGVVQYKIDSTKLHYKIVNAGLSGETSAGGKNRINWILKQKVNVFVLELGANDGLRGIPIEETERNLQAIIDTVKIKYPQAKLVMLGMQVPPNMGAAYAYSYNSIFGRLAQKNKMTLMPFLLKDVGGVPSLNQEDGIHPNIKGARIVGNNVFQVLKEIL